MALNVPPRFPCQASSILMYVQPCSTNPEAAIARALRSTFSASTRLPQQFQLFQPIGGVRAIVSPTTIRNLFSLAPLVFSARRVTTCSPAFLNAPVIWPVVECNFNSFGKPLAENLMGRSAVAGIRYRNGEPGRTPKTD